MNPVNPVNMIFPYLDAATHGLKEEDALTRGMDEKSRKFVEKGAEVYAKA